MLQGARGSLRLTSEPQRRARGASMGMRSGSGRASAVRLPASDSASLRRSKATSSTAASSCIQYEPDQAGVHIFRRVRTRSSQPVFSMPRTFSL